MGVPRYRPVTIRMAPTTWAALKAAADEEGISVADFVRGSVHYVMGLRAGIRIAEHDRPAAELVLKTLGVAEWRGFDEPDPPVEAS